MKEKCMSSVISYTMNSVNPYWNIGFKSVYVSVWKLVNSPSCVVSVHNVIHNLPGKGTEIGKKYTERIGADLSCLSWFCVFLVRFQGEWWSRGFLSKDMKLSWGRDGCVPTWAMMPGWRGNIAKSFCDILPWGTVSSSHVRSVVFYKLLTSVETTRATD